MENKKVVIALGGNALEEKGKPSTAENQLSVVKKTAEKLAKISAAGYEIAIVHGNGPQVGRILLASETAHNVTPRMPFDVCGAMSQGYIGYHIQQAMKAALNREGRGDIPVVSLVTQVVVDEKDNAFENPTKPIGIFYTKEEAEKLERENGYVMKEDAGRGYRRVVPSPKPKEIVEFETLKRLWDSTIVILCGGGGVPVVKQPDGNLEGVAAVIDKDLAAGLVAQSIGADVLMILTEVEKVSIHFRQPDQQDLPEMTVAEAEKYMDDEEFAPGSMLPKVQAAVEFVKSKEGRTAVITSLDQALEALEGKAGTKVVAGK
ncbi:carbamate kinase [Cuneatibacter sp. NSJ-177]|uniref:carbamate kinase n=1 Tax=Cuneatibacter sp. NSJ-177 TaxID=2931401 RepID=UPI001FD30068|nr:carbamate kinase [Cuneatibacter sp. NSJ-177]MCJ7834107.1 carbamate kinase [Cuneatibacter sp. NSJ-177]